MLYCSFSDCDAGEEPAAEEGKGQWERAWAALMWTFGGGCVFSFVAARVRGAQTYSLIENSRRCNAAMDVRNRW